MHSISSNWKWHPTVLISMKLYLRQQQHHHHHHHPGTAVGTADGMVRISQPAAKEIRVSQPAVAIAENYLMEKSATV